jgi:DNA repair protein RecN (Recombination protein N)
MLQTLKIKNFALIDSLEIDFEKGFTTITGETGAGKSIILGALSLLIGQRADSSVLKNPSEKSIIEASFNIIGYDLESFFKDNDIDYETESVIRREIAPNGKSRAFVNDSPVTLDILKSLGENLIDIHSQHENSLLNTSDFQQHILDSSAKIQSEVIVYNDLFTQLKKKEQELEKIKKQAESSNLELQFKQFLFEELERAKLIAGEQIELEEEFEKLNHTEDLKDAYSQAQTIFNSDETNVIGQIKTVITLLTKSKTFFKPSEQLISRLDQNLIELKDIASEINNHCNDIYADPERQQIVGKRLDILLNLEQKHKVQTIEQLLEIQKDLEQFILRTTMFDDSIEALLLEIENSTIELKKAATILLEKRQKAAIPLSKTITEKLKELGMPNVVFQIDVMNTNELRRNGNSETKYMFSANKNMSLQPITETASGGELSRIMLCLKAELSEAKSLPTIIFDEIDTGVSGDIADKMGNIMKEMSRNMQVICITHLAQIAAKGNEHHIVYKQDNETTTNTNIKKLTNEERINEIAKMVSGKNLTNAAIQNAKELLKS